ncbi:phosphoadenosine phosphosulfate reductase domain-containing protein [Clostridium vitabionis]|uniref:phosphoadenosine phosphosulfate reductase domain-containing protein n=1 Tax=Clostridium vitabionis TaxID=2784388 RepID=UPI00188B2676|nr:phosphoadenosine phosphosulfate reductase family protein [Clostridium vitabionis]
MYSYNWDPETGGLLLNSSPLKFSKEPRPVYYKELDILGFDRYWNYEKDDSYPYMWAEANNYIYRGRLVAKTKGGSVYTAPELILLENPEPDGMPLRFVDIPAMVSKNQEIIDTLAQDTIKKIYNTYIEYSNKVDVFYVAFSGGKDSVVTLDLTQRALPHNKFKVLFGDTGMEFPDTYEEMRSIENDCREEKIEFLKAKSRLSPAQSWNVFGPPAVTIRWCCSVHKSAPQILLLREYTKNPNVRGMAFTGIRGDESLSRSEYEEVNDGKKIRGQFSFHPILEWNSAELFSYIYQRKLRLNAAYKKGNSRVGCLVCPMSSGKHEYMKAVCYPTEVNSLLDKIKATSGKINLTESQMDEFVDDGLWKTRKTGRELNFGADSHLIDIKNGKTTIMVRHLNDRWKVWAKTIGDFVELTPTDFTINFKQKNYSVHLQTEKEGIRITFPQCGTGKDDIKFISLFRSVIVKSVYCVRCGVCEANCTANCIDMTNGLKISDSCIHCYQCHDIYEHCLRYNSIRNKAGGDRQMKSLDRYFSFGVRKRWIELYFQDRGTTEFWNSDGHGEVANKKKDAFLNFVKDAGLVTFNRLYGDDKYTRNEPNEFADILFDLGSESDSAWALMLCNLAYTPEFNWFIKSVPFNENITQDRLKYMLNEVMTNDTKGLGKRNISDALKIILVKTPLGEPIGLGDCDYTEKVNASGNETVTLNSFHRGSWHSPDPKVILYSLYKFAENCGDYYQFTLARLLDFSVDSNGVSPAEIFGLDRDIMEKIITSLSINHPDFLTTQFNLNLDTITLNAEKRSGDVLELF